MNDGTGFDGEFYRRVMENFSEDFFSSGYDAFRVQRIFPFFVLHYAFESLHVSPMHANLMHALLALHLGNLLLQILFFFKLSKILHWKNSTLMVLLACFFFCFPTLKGCGYEPFQTDAFAVTLSLVSFVLFLFGKTFLSLAVGFLGIVTWPTVTLQAILLICFDKPLPSSHSSKFSFAKHFPPVYGCLAVLSILLVEVTHHGGVLQNLMMRDSNFVLTGFSLLAIVVFLRALLGFAPECGKLSFANLVGAFTSCRCKVLLFSIFVWMAVKFYLSLHTNEEVFSSNSLFALQILWRPLKYPLIPVVGHVAFFGIFPVLVLLLFRQFSEEFISRSAGFAMLFLGFLVLSLDSESRHLASFVPVLLLPLGKALNRLDLKPARAFSLVFLQLALSHFYLPINTGLLPGQLQSGNFNLPESQRYFMNFGAYMNLESYLIWMAVSALSFVAVIWILNPFGKSRR